MMIQITFALYPIFLAGVALVWMLKVRSRNKFSWLLKATASGSIVAFVFLAGPWAFTSYYLRYGLLGLFTLVILYSYWRMKLSGTVCKGQPIGQIIISLSVLLLFTMLNAAAIASHIYPSKSLNLSFPLRAGNYYVLQGGNSLITNPFHALSGSKLALDIVRLNTFGNRAKGIAPRALDNYEIFGDRVYSPCAGIIASVRGNLLDNVPGKTNMEYPEGNYIIVKCAEAEILIAHLKQGSVVVNAGEVVLPGQLLGQVGNSGNTLEPHLHIGARKSGVEMGIIFNGRRLSLNSVAIGIQKNAQPGTPANRP